MLTLECNDPVLPVRAGGADKIPTDVIVFLKELRCILCVVLVFPRRAILGARCWHMRLVSAAGFQSSEKASAHGACH